MGTSYHLHVPFVCMFIYTRCQNVNRVPPGYESASNARTPKRKPDLTDKHAYASIPPASADDEISFERNQKLLMEEFRKPKPKYDTIKQLMTCTFPMCRESVMSNNDSIVDILSSYPMLKKSNIVSVLQFFFSCIHSSFSFACTLQLAHEYSFVVQDAECREKFLHNFPLWVRAIVSYCKEAKISSMVTFQRR